MSARRCRLATTAVPMRDFFTLPHPYAEGVTREAVAAGSRERVRRLCGYFEQAWRDGADFVTGYESIVPAGLYWLNPATRHIFEALLEPIPGPTTDVFAKLARRYERYCAVCLYERDGDEVFNTAALIDRRGEVVGKYRKVHLPPQERAFAAPGNGFPVFETDFGRLGFSICYDLMFPESALCVAMNGADLLVHIGNTVFVLQEETIRVRAADQKLWLLTANHVEGTSVIADPGGQIVARAGPAQPVACAEVDLASTRPLPPDDLLAGSRNLRHRMCQERVPAAYAVLTAERAPLRLLADPLPGTAAEVAALLGLGQAELREQARQWQSRLDQAGGALT